MIWKNVNNIKPRDHQDLSNDIFTFFVPWKMAEFLYFLHVFTLKLHKFYMLCKNVINTAPSPNQELSNDTFISSVCWKLAEISPMEIQSIKQASKQARFVNKTNGPCSRFACLRQPSAMRQMHLMGQKILE